MTLSTAIFDGTGDNVGAANDRRSSDDVGTAAFGGSPLSSACKNDGMGADSAGFPPAAIGSVGKDTDADGADSAGGNILPPSDGNMFGKNGKLTTEGISVGGNDGVGVGFGEASSDWMPPPPLLAVGLFALALTAALLLLLLSTPLLLLLLQLITLLLLLLLLLLVKAHKSRALTGA